MGALLIDQQRPADAVSYLIAAVQSNPRYEKAYLLLAKSYAALGENDKRDQMVQRLQVIRDENRLSSKGRVKMKQQRVILRPHNLRR